MRVVSVALAKAANFTNPAKPGTEADDVVVLCLYSTAFTGSAACVHTTEYVVLCSLYSVQILDSRCPVPGRSACAMNGDSRYSIF